MYTTNPFTILPLCTVLILVQYYPRVQFGTIPLQNSYPRFQNKPLYNTNPCTILAPSSVLTPCTILLLFTMLPLCTVLTLVTPVYNTLLTHVHCKILTLVQLHRLTRLRICSNYEDRLSRPKVSWHAMLHLHERFFDCHLTTTCCI